MDNDSIYKPVRVLPFSLEDLRTVLPTPTMPVEECDICRAIDGGGSKLVKGGELEYDNLPTGVQQLKYFMRLGEHIETNWLNICPQCGRLYYCEKSYEFLIGGSEDYESYGAIRPDAVLELAEVSWAKATGNAEIHALDDGKWCIVHNPEKSGN